MNSLVYKVSSKTACGITDKPWLITITTTSITKLCSFLVPDPDKWHASFQLKKIYINVKSSYFKVTDYYLQTKQKSLEGMSPRFGFWLIRL